MSAIVSTPAQTASVIYRLAVVDADGTARAVQSAKRNLIMDAGLNMLATRNWSEMLGRATYGTGTAPTKRDSGSVTFTRAGNTVTASAGFFLNTDVGALLKFDTGEEMYVTAYASATSVTVSVSGTLAASEGTVWFVNQTALESAVGTVELTSTGTSYATGTHTLSYTGTFAAVGATTVAREIGWMVNAAPYTTLFGRDLLTAPVTLLAGQQLRVTVDLLVQVGPLTPQVYTNTVTGWTSNGEQQLVSTDLISPASGGLITVGTFSGAFAISTPSRTTGTEWGTLLVEAGSAPATYALPYTAGDFALTREAVLSPSSFSSTGIRSLYYLAGGAYNFGLYFRVALDTAESKTALQSLTLRFRFTWGRVLAN